MQSGGRGSAASGPNSGADMRDRGWLPYTVCPVFDYLLTLSRSIAKVKQGRRQSVLFQLIASTDLHGYSPGYIYPRSIVAHLQPEIYRAVIDDVVSSVKVDFEEYGMEEEILMHLQQVGLSYSALHRGSGGIMTGLLLICLKNQKWEAKLLETRVADFARAGSSSKSPSPTLESKPEPSSPPAGPSNSQSADMFPFPRQGQVQGSSAAMPGAPGVGAVGTNGFVNGGVQVPGGQQGEIRVKMDPDELMRLRGGAVCSHSCVSLLAS